MKDPSTQATTPPPRSDVAPIIYAFIKFGQQEHLEDLRRRGVLRMQRLAAFQEMEDTVWRGDKDDGLSAVYRPDQVVMTFGGHTITGIVGPIKVAHNAIAAQHVFCLTAVDSRRSEAILIDRLPVVAPENMLLGEYALVIVNVTEFMARVKAATERARLSFMAGLVEYVDYDTHHGLLGPFRKRASYAHQSEWRLLLPASDDDIFWFELGQGLEDISEIVPSASLNSLLHLKAPT